MSFMDLLRAGVMALAMLKSKHAYDKGHSLGIAKKTAALVVALLLHPYAAGFLGTTTAPARVEGFLDVVISLPAGPGTPVARGLMWLTEADLPEIIAQSIRNAWLRDITADVEAMSKVASRVVAKALLNLACFVGLFLWVRWLLNLVSVRVVLALPPSLARGSRMLSLALGLAQSIAVCAILVAIVAPLIVTDVLPPVPVEHLRHSRLADMLLAIFHCLNLYRL